MMIGGVAAGAAVRSWPFRVFSFPSGIIEPNVGVYDLYDPMYDSFFVNEAFIEHLKDQTLIIPDIYKVRTHS